MRTAIDTTIPHLRRHAPVLALLLALATTALVYGRALGLPFFYDDTFDLTRTEEQSFGSLLRGIHGYAYYRPLPLLIWKALYLLQGRYDPALLHGIALLAHALAGWLLYLLVRRLTGSEWALVPMLLFLTFPFGYQVVPIVGSLFHPLVVLLMLATLYLYLVGRSEARPALLAASAGTAVLAYWTHEFGVLVAGYVVALELVLWWRRGERRPSFWPLAHLTGAAAFLLVWASVPKAPSPVPADTGEVVHKLLFYLQGLAYPATGLLVPLQDRLGWQVADRTLLAGGLALGVAALAYWSAVGWGPRRPERSEGSVFRVMATGKTDPSSHRMTLEAATETGSRSRVPISLIALLGLGWSVTALAPIVWRLNWPYVENAPRLLYLPAVGAAVVWGLLPALGGRSRWLTLAWRGAVCLGLVLTLWLSLRTIERRMDMLGDGGRLVEGVVAAAQAHPDDRLLFVNIPSWFALHHQEYARGNLGVTMLPNYIGLDRVIYAHTGLKVDVQSLGFAHRPGEWPYGWDPHGAPVEAAAVDAAVRAADVVYTAVPGPGGPNVYAVGGLARGSTAGAAPVASLRAGVDLVAARIDGTPDALTLDLSWHVHRPFAAGTVEVVQLRDPDGAVVAEWRGYALNGIWPPELWRVGDRIDDRLRLRLAPASQTGPLSVWVGLVPADSAASIDDIIEIGTVAPEARVPSLREQRS